MSISITDVVAISGTPGLFKIVKSDDKSIIVESIDERKKRQMVRGNMMVSKLADVSIYTEDGESEPLIHILQSMKEKYQDKLPVTKKSSGKELMEFLKTVLPTYDEEKVYPSNVKKLVGWFEIILLHDIDMTIEEEEKEEEIEEKEEEKEEKKKEDSPKKKTTKSAPKKSAPKKSASKKDNG